jgi:FkbM family methyltransferase
MFNHVVDTADTLMRGYMRLAGYLQPVRQGKTFFGANLTCDIRDFVPRRIFFFAIYEPNLTYFIQSCLRPGDTFVDLGANIGYFSLLAAEVVGAAGRVIAIEASPSTFSRLSDNVANNQYGNVKCWNLAATAADCTINMVCGDQRNTGANKIAVLENAAGVVRGKPLPDILGEDFQRVNFIKIDIEGSEGPILEQLLANLDRLPQRLTIVAELAATSAQYIERFREKGFRIRALPNTYRIGYFLIRQYLQRFGEESYTVTVPIQAFSASYTDYIFERE